jgi:hypothetical protein
MSSASGAISFKQAAQVAAFALAYHTVSPDNLNTTISTLALAEIGCMGIDLACKSRKWVKEAQLLHQDLQKLLDDATLYQEYLGLEPFLPAHDCETEIASTLPRNREIRLDGSTLLPQEILEILFSHMTVEQITRFSGMSRCCYIATKTDSIWQCQLNKLLPKLAFIPREQCGLTPEQQFKIVYRRTYLLLKEFNSTYKTNSKLAETIYNDFKLAKTTGDISQPALYDYYSNRLSQLVGDHYVGTDESIDRFSSLGRIKTCINELEKDYQAFAIPERLQAFMRQAKKTIDIQNRLKDFPERVRKMQTLADQDIFTDTYICAAIEIHSYEFAPKVVVWAGALLTKTWETTIGLIHPNIKSRRKILLDKMLEYQPGLSEDLASYHYSKFTPI